MSSIPQTDNKIRPVKSNGNLAAALGPEQFAAFPQKSDRILQIAGLLQTTLNVEEILTQFGNEIQSSVPHEHLNYVYEKTNLNFVIGKRARHSCTYQLSINNSQLGILSLTRHKKFTESEIKELEYLICAIHYPLRNALLYQEAVNAAHKDPLTGIGNRAAMSTTLHREIELAFRHNRSLGVIMMDVDHFKNVNDKFGHSTGDFLLQSLVECAEKSVRISDRMFRYGGEEFVIVLPETDETGVLRLAKRIRRRVEKLESIIDKQTIAITVSLGITTLHPSDDEKTFLGRADEALYRAKRDGRNCIRIVN
ncbi:MAG: GGDEF domain-containing protein [Gammaproteobacteria bacterium]|nr:GGDEF domain-containing protein [Gammaproteobacteria bacterium]